MSGKIILSTAYLPPVEYFSQISRAGKVLIEKEENYHKQTYRNRCYILSAHGPQLLSVPVLRGSVHKTRVKEVRIDYSKRWQQVHIRALKAAYGSSPFFQYYFDELEKILVCKNEFLIDLNLLLIEKILSIIKIKAEISYTSEFTPVEGLENDLRYNISPKEESGFFVRNYLQVFGNEDYRFAHSLSIVDLIFNTGPESIEYL